MNRRPALVVAAAAMLLGLLAPVPASAEVADGWDYYRLDTISPTAIPVSGQFTGDDSTDVLAYVPGATTDYLYDFTTRNDYSLHPLSIGGTFTPIVGDFGGDDYDDIIWYAKGSAPDALWISDGRGGFRSKPLTINGDYEPMVLADYRDYGGKDDLLFLGAGAVKDYLWHFTDRSGDDDYVGPGTFASRPLQVNGNYRLVVGDWTGDAIEDVVLYQPGPAKDYRWDSNAAGQFKQTNLAVNGNYTPSTVYQTDRDGIFWLGVGAQAEAYWTSNGPGFTSRPIPGVSGGVGTVSPLALGWVMVLDETGDDLVFEGTATGGAYYTLTSGVHDRTTQRPSLGDFDADGRADVIWSGPPNPEIWYQAVSAQGAGRRGVAPSKGPSPSGDGR
ncbi:hypothetical protein BH10ACT1_BH10ACT1_08630 [soil metagenome]